MQNERIATHHIHYRASIFDQSRGQFGAHVELHVVRGKNATTGDSWQIEQRETGRAFPIESASKAAERRAFKAMSQAIGDWNANRANTGPFPLANG